MSEADASGRIEAGSARPPTASLPVAKPGEGLCEIALHGHRVFYRSAGSGPVLVADPRNHIDLCDMGLRAPVARGAFHRDRSDLIGHGESAKPRGEYSLGAYAAGSAIC